MGHFLRFKPQTVTHADLINLLYEEGVVDIEEAQVNVHFHEKTFLTISAIAQLACWGLEKLRLGCSFKFVGQETALRYPKHIGLYDLLEQVEPQQNPIHDVDDMRTIPICLLKDRDESIDQARERVCTLVKDTVSELFQFHIGLFLPN